MKAFSWELYNRLPVIGILRSLPLDTLRHLVPAVQRGGLTCLEVTMNSAGAAEQIDRIRQLGGDGLNVGAGTVTTMERLETALAAGASFIVTPVVVPEIIVACRQASIPVMPGAFTPTEIFQAWSLGADIVKLFPAGRLGPGYIRDVKAPLSEVRLLATGGVDVESLPAFHAAGAEGFGVGSPLFDKERIAAGDWNWLEAQAGRFAAAYASCCR